MESLRLDGVAKKFGENTIFRDFSYFFQDKTIYVLRGASGAGKTTLLRIIAGLDRCFTGTVTGGGADNVSYVFQEYRLFPTLSALANAALGCQDTEGASEKAAALLSTLGFTESEMKLPPRKLSGGMKQRVSIARALLKPSRILLLDEVTKELDPALVQIVLGLIKQEALHRTVIMVTHNPEEATALGATEIEIPKDTGNAIALSNE